MGNFIPHQKIKTGAATHRANVQNVLRKSAVARVGRKKMLDGVHGESIIYFGPMGCQTGFYLLTRGLDNGTVFDTVVDVLKKIISHEGQMFGARREECGNYRNLDVQAARRECAAYLEALLTRGADFEYPKE